MERTGARLLEVPIAWLEQQFRAMRRRDARELAIALMAAYEGAALLTNTFRDPKIMWASVADWRARSTHSA